MAALAAAGQAPAVGDLLVTAATAATENPTGFVVGGVWPSLWSSVEPDRHGFYASQQLVDGSYEVRKMSPDDIERPAFWSHLARAGRRCCVIDVPLTPLTEHDRCVHVVEWGTHDRMLEPMSSPPEVLDQAGATVGAHTVTKACDDYARAGEHRQLRDDLLAGIGQKTALTRQLIGAGQLDLAVTVFSESHCAGHLLWGIHDPGDDTGAAALRAELGDPLLDVYRALDRALGELVESTDASTTLVVVLSHGMAGHYEGDHLLAEVLRRLDDAQGRPSAAVRAREQLLRPVDRWRHRRRRARELGRPAADRPWMASLDSTRRFSKVPNIGLYGGIRVNLAGREPRGRVQPGAELDAVTGRLRDDLLALVDPDTGRPIVVDVLRTRDLYDGELVDALPDLLVVWDPSGPKTGAASALASARSRACYPGVRPGDHRPPGWCWCGVRASPRGRSPSPCGGSTSGPLSPPCSASSCPTSTGGRSVGSCRAVTDRADVRGASAGGRRGAGGSAAARTPRSTRVRPAPDAPAAASR